MAEGTFQSLEIDAPAELLYDTAADIASYPEWATGVKEVEILERGPREEVLRARFVIEVMVKEIEYVLQYDHDRPERLSWVAEENDDLKMLEGSYTFTPSDGATEVLYGLKVELNFTMPGFLMRQAEKQIVTTALRGSAQARGRTELIMRIILVTGKGGVGKTTVAASTALAAADAGYRTLVTSTDPAHSLADALMVPLGSDPGRVVPELDGQQIDTQRQLDRYWGSIRRQLMDVLDWGGVAGIEAEEFLVFPGMDELFALLEVNRHARSGDYEVIVVDCAPTAETLRLLSLPEVLSWYFEKVLPTERRLMRAARPILSRLTDLPIPEDEVFMAAQSVFESIDSVKTLMSTPEVTSARLVVNPEKMVIDEARRTYSYLSLFGYGVDSVVVNRVLPDIVADPYFERWRAIQKGHLDTVDDAFPEIPRMRLRLFDDEMVGIDSLRFMASELYGDRDPIADFVATRPFRVIDVPGGVSMEVDIPFVEKSELDVYRHGHEIYIQVGPYRRSFILPDALHRREVTRARLDEGTLTVSFSDPDARS